MPLVDAAQVALGLHRQGQDAARAAGDWDDHDGLVFTDPVRPGWPRPPCCEQDGQPNTDAPFPIRGSGCTAIKAKDLRWHRQATDPPGSGLRNSSSTSPRCDPGPVDLGPLLNATRIHTDDDGRRWDDEGQAYEAVDVDGEVTYRLIGGGQPPRPAAGDQ